MKSSLNTLLQSYSESHQNPKNQIIHKFCVPLIMWSLLGMLSEVPSPVNLAYALLTFGLLYYLRFKNLSVYGVVLIQVVPMMILIHLLQPYFDWRHWLGIFVVAWIGQFIGHKIEGKKPSFFEDIFFLLIGPIWILKRFLKM